MRVELLAVEPLKRHRLDGDTQRLSRNLERPGSSACPDIRLRQSRLRRSPVAQQPKAAPKGRARLPLRGPGRGRPRQRSCKRPSEAHFSGREAPGSWIDSGWSSIGQFSPRTEACSQSEIDFAVGGNRPLEARPAPGLARPRAGTTRRTEQAGFRPGRQSPRPIDEGALTSNRRAARTGFG